MINISGIKKGHYGYALRFAVYDKGRAIDLSTYTTLSLKVWKEGQSSAKWTLSGTHVKENIVDFNVTESHFDEAGDFLAEIEWTKTGVKDGSETFGITVEESV